MSTRALPLCRMALAASIRLVCSSSWRPAGRHSLSADVLAVTQRLIGGPEICPGHQTPMLQIQYFWQQLSDGAADGSLQRDRRNQSGGASQRKAKQCRWAACKVLGHQVDVCAAYLRHQGTACLAARWGAAAWQPAGPAGRTRCSAACGGAVGAAAPAYQRGHLPGLLWVPAWG